MCLISLADVGFGFESFSYTTSETEGSVEVAVVKYGSSTLPLSVRLSTTSDSATSPQDFTEIVSQDISFAPGERRQTVNIVIVNDNVLEDAEQFSVVLTQIHPQTRLMEMQNLTTITITDNDCECNSSMQLHSYYFRKIRVKEEVRGRKV